MDLEDFVECQKDENLRQQTPALGRDAIAVLCQSLHQQGRQQQQRAAEQGGQVEFPVHVEAVEPMLLRPEAVNAHLHNAVGQQQSRGDGRQQPADRSWGERNDSDLA